MPIFDDLDRFSMRTALITEKRKISYQELLSLSDTLGKAIGQRCLCFILCRNSVESVAGYIGCMRHDIIPVLLNESIDHALLTELLENYRPKYCWVPKVLNTSVQIPGECIFCIGDYVLYATEYKQDYDLSPELGLLLTTSGSTGSPKFVRQSYRNLESNTASIIQYLDIKEDDRAISTLPMNYTYGLSILNTHLVSGACEILTEAPMVDRSFWNLLRTENATTFGGVPYTYEMLKKLRFERMNLPSLRYLTQAGGKLSPELCMEFSELCAHRGMKFIVMYGQTEATARMSWLPFEYAQSKAGSIGVAIPGGQFMLEDENGAVIRDPNVAGELVYRGNNVTLGYAECRFDLSKTDRNHGVLHTGDIAKRDADGFYYIVGRKKRFLKIFGNRVNLDEVESLLKKQGIECACAGADDRLIIFVTDADAVELARTYIGEHTAISHSGFQIRLIDRIPYSESGKVLYSGLNAND